MTGWRTLLAVILTLIFTSTASAGERYKILDGDTLQVLARDFGVTVDEILGANTQIKNPNIIYPGMVIYLPGSLTAADRNSAENAGTPAPKSQQKQSSQESEAITGWTAPRVERQGVPDGLLRVHGLEWRSASEAWELMIRKSDCYEGVCKASMEVENIGNVPVEGLSVSWSAWYYRLQGESDCKRLDPGEKCTVTMTYESGYYKGAPGFIIVQASDAFIRPPDTEVVWFWDTVFWICPAVDQARCRS